MMAEMEPEKTERKFHRANCKEYIKEILSEADTEEPDYNFLFEDNTKELELFNRKWLLEFSKNSERIDKDQEIEREDFREGAAFLRYIDYDSAGATSSNEKFVGPCTAEYLHGLLADFATYLCNAHEVKGRFPSSPDADSAEKKIRRIMNQCRRLKNCPELFPSPSSRESFLSEVATLASTIVSMEEVVGTVEESVSELISDMRPPLTAEILERMATERRASEAVDSVVAVDTAVEMLRKRLDRYQIPTFLPDQFQGKNPWNSWLDNSAEASPGWIAIQQKIPRCGDTLLRQITMLYEMVDQKFSDDGLLLSKDEETLNFPSPGEEYKHMSWSGFYTISQYDLGFKNGGRKHYDSEGRFTLEFFSKILGRLYETVGIEEETKNCPYFRFAMGKVAN